MYKVKFHPRFKKQLKKLHPQDQKRFLKVIPKLVKNPFSEKLDIKKLTLSGYRLRIGDFRVLYSVDEKEKNIYVWEIGYRGGVY